jgi:hypothetical protein
MMMVHPDRLAYLGQTTLRRKQDCVSERWVTCHCLRALQLEKHHKLPLPLSGWFWKMRILRFTEML